MGKQLFLLVRGPCVFQRPKYRANSFSIIFPRVSNIRRKSNDFEDRLQTKYQAPQIVNVPDDFDPALPRMLFLSKDGFSQIVVSQVSFVLNVNYSENWQEDVDRERQYVEKQLPYLFGLFDFLPGIQPSFCGITTQVAIPTKVNDKVVLDELVKLYIKTEVFEDLHDVQVKIANVRSDKFFSNITVENYRTWYIRETEDHVPKLRRGDATEVGVQISGDFNDRYAFNENQDYTTTRETAKQIITGGFDDVRAVIDLLGETQ